MTEVKDAPKTDKPPEATAPAPSKPAPPKGWKLPRCPIVGETLRWYENARRDAGPVAAIVTHVEFEKLGQVTLTLLPPNTDIRFKRGVRHIDDPELESRPGLRQSSGAWEYVN